MGQPDIYPFILSPAVIKKLGAIHDLVHGDGLLATEPAAPKPAAEPGPAPEPEVIKAVQEILQQAAQPQPKVTPPPH
jgi:hypothetical protein